MGGEGEGRATGIAAVVARAQARVTPLVERVLATRVGSLGVDVMDRFGAAGGGVTAAGLAYSLIFAIVPTMLILVSLLGIFITDAAELERLVNLLIAQFPPLEALVTEILKQVSAGAWTFSFIGLIGLFWGASRSYAALDSSVALYFPREPRRDIVRQTIESIVSVIFFLGSAIGGVVVVWWVADLSIIPSASGDALLRRVVGAAAVTLWLVTVLLLVYRFVPARHIRWREAVVPAIVAGVAISGLTQVFAIVTPLFFTSLRLYGAFVALFAALIWLALCTQIVLIGVAWLARRVGAPKPERPGTPAPVAESAVRPPGSAP
jgi:membrane protein